MRNVRRSLCLVLLCFLLVGILMPMRANAAETPAFTKQPVGGEVVIGETLTVSWSLNFTPTRQRVVWASQGSDTVHKVTITIGNNATSVELPARASNEEYMIQAYYLEGGVEKWVTSDRFRITSVAPYTEDSVFKVGKTVKVDEVRLGAASEDWMDAYFDDKVTYKWYRNGTVISGATGSSYTIQRQDVDCEIYALVSRTGASIKTPKETISHDVFVGGVGMLSGDYLASGATATTTTKPANNYAYYADGVLTLHNYTYSGLGYEVNSNTFAAVYAPEDVTIKLEGENSITKTSGGATNEYVFYMKNNLTLLEGTDEGKLTATSSEVGIFVQKDLTIENGTYHITAEQRDPIYVKEGNIQIKDGTFVLNAQRTGLQTYTGGITIEKGTFNITAATSRGISSSDLIIKDGVFTIVSKEEGLWITGNCTIENGTFNITSGSEGIQVGGESLVIKDGEFTINGKTGIDCANVSSVIEGGNIRITSAPSSGKGILVDGHELIIKGGEVTIDSSYTGIWLDEYADLIIEGGRLQIDTGTGDGICSLYEYGNVSVRGGNVRITGASYGINCDQLTIEGGDLVVIAEKENGHALYTADTIIASTLYAGGTTELGTKLEVYDPAKEFDYVHVEVHPTPFIRVPEVWVGDVNLSSGEYLAVGTTAPTTTKPAAGGYAHYASGVLTLHNYTYSGKGYKYKNTPYTEYAFIYTMVDCTIVLEGTNTLTWEGSYLQYDKGRGIVPLGALTVTAASADASLTMVTDEDGILASTAVAITGGNISIDATDSGRGIDIKTGGSLTIQNTNLYVVSYAEAINAEDCGIAIQNSTLELWPNADEGIYSVDDITITDSHVEIQTTQDCIATTGTVTVNGSSFVSVRSTATSDDSNCSAFDVGTLVVDPALTVQASVDVFSGLGTYVDANRATYDWVMISETGITSPHIYVGGIGLASGQYLATGATVPTTTQPTGGYAHYASGVLTLHDYSYTGTGFAYDSELFVAVLYEGDLTVNLEGTNVLDCQTPGGEYDGSCGLRILGDLVLDAAENASLAIHTVVPSGGFSDGAAICAYGSVTVRDGTYTLENGIQAGADLTIEDGTFHITTSVSGSGLYSGQDITIKGGSFTIDGGYYSIAADDQIVIENGIFTLTPDETGLHAYSNSVTIKNGVLNINCMDVGIDGHSGVTIQGGSIAIQSMDQGIATGSSGSVTINGGNLWVTAVYEGFQTASTIVNGGNLSVKSTDTSNDSAWCAIDSTLTVASGIPIQASTEPTGGLGAYEAAAHDSYDWIVIGTIEDTPMSYAVYLFADPYDAGTVTGAGMYEAGTSVTVNAVPDEHHNFANWTEGGVVVSTSASYTFTIAANRDLTANFAPKNYTVSVSASPAAGGTVTGAGTYPYNTYITVTATANPGYHFLRWVKDGVEFGTNPTKSFSLEGNCSLIAVFAPDSGSISHTVAVSASPAEGGTVTGAGTYADGAAVTVTATAKPGFHFVKWMEGETQISTDASYSFVAIADRALVAVFEPNPPAPTFTVAVSASPAEGGTVTGAGTFEENSSVTVTATAKAGFHFVKWTEGGTQVSTAASYTFTVTGNRNLVAVFEADAPAPTDPTEPAPTDPTEPAPTDPTEPAPTDPTEPAPTDPTEPAPTDPTEPAPTDPTEPTEPTPPPTSGTLNGMFRLAGKSRYETGFAIAGKLKEILGVDKFSAVIVAYGQNFPDALTGSYLAAVKGAPILLTEPSADANLLAYLQSNLITGGKVYILGGTAAVSQEFENNAKNSGFDVKRLKGAGRYETNLAILEEAGVNTTDEVLIATGKNYADSLSASATGLPMLLVDKNLTDAQKAFLQNTSKKFVILGGTGAVSAEVEAELDAIGDVTRVKGASRYGTSVEIAKRYFDSPSAAVLAYAQGFPDGLCGGPLAYAVGAPLILTSNESSQLADEYVAGIGNGAVTGGAARISDDTVREIFDLPATTPIVKP